MVVRDSVVRWNDITRSSRYILLSASLGRGFQIMAIMKGAKAMD